MKESARYITILLAFIAGAFVLSWCAVYSFWLGAYIFRSLPAVRVANHIGSAILLPARTFLRLPGDTVEQMTLLTDPLLYASINAALLGILAYAGCRRWIFKQQSGGG